MYKARLCTINCILSHAAHATAAAVTSETAVHFSVDSWYRREIFRSSTASRPAFSEQLASLHTALVDLGFSQRSLLSLQSFWVVTPSSFVGRYRRFRGNFCLHFPSRWRVEKWRWRGKWAYLQDTGTYVHGVRPPQDRNLVTCRSVESHASFFYGQADRPMSHACSLRARKPLRSSLRLEYAVQCSSRAIPGVEFPWMSAPSKSVLHSLEIKRGPRPSVGPGDGWAPGWSFRKWSFNIQRNLDCTN
jgi:hypothetical protein